ncbi:hypothetical protein ABE28_003280 [Peribacillus muralis]|uniref:Uncharacterized protein n=1 Tax=Peribacillus muralis TaxID=264697 RepID=A0A1B3XJL8_9BACI|nr:hypothetical protein [Peribacillus muralis]AOH53362.1 hypothetical protein ABE28_003280 [Peribacillus muralis]
MYLIGNVLIALLFAVLLFVLFTFVNVHSFSKHPFTSFFLTLSFLYLFLIMPFKGTNKIYKSKNKIMKSIKKDRTLSSADRHQIEKIISNKLKIFYVLFKSGAFSYNELMLELSQWYLNKPFKFKLNIKIKVTKAKHEYENAYISSLQKDLKEAVAFA